MRADWQTRPERGSDALIRFIAWLSLNTNRAVGRFLLYPICAYFFVSSGTARRASHGYLSTVLGRKASAWQVYRHYLVFSQVLLDRVFFLSGRSDEFDIKIVGRSVIDQALARNRGCLFLGAHHGSFEVLRVLGVSERKLRIKVLMYPDNSRRFLSLVERLNPDLAREMIPLGKPNTMLLAKQHLDTGGVIGLLGDRIAKGDKVLYAPFLGQRAPLPAGPILLASLLKIPVILFSGTYLGGTRYEMSFELFADEIAIDRACRQEDLQIWIDRYAEQLDRICRRAPYNWFNFYDFWDRAEDSDTA